VAAGTTTTVGRSFSIDGDPISRTGRVNGGSLEGLGYWLGLEMEDQYDPCSAGWKEGKYIQDPLLTHASGTTAQGGLHECLPHRSWVHLLGMGGSKSICMMSMGEGA